MIVTASGCNIDWYEYFNQYGLVPNVRGRGKKNRIKQEVLNLICAFDIESSTVWCNPDRSLYDVHSFMYVWKMQIEETYTIKGRTWEEFFNLLDDLKKAIFRIREEKKLSENPLLVIWVHNLAYEWTFLSGLYTFRQDECFFREARKPIYCKMFDSFEFRCSYIQSNLSLSALCKQCGVEEKLSGYKYNYDIVRYPWTELNDYEEEYTTRDVRSLVECMRYRLKKYNDTLITIPLTSTGYVRRECLEALKEKSKFLRGIKPECDEYSLLRESFRGGNTHANRYYVGKIIDNVYSYDIASSYPTQQLTHQFPMGRFRWLPIEHLKQDDRMELVLSHIGLNDAVVATYVFKNIRLKNHREPIPYISLSRCDAIGFRIDNGRILYAESLRIAMTEIDFFIVNSQYQFDSIGVINCMIAKKDYLPEEYRKVILDYYEKKTALKGDDSEDGLYMYTKSKNMLNAIYGMSATDPLRKDIKYVNGEWSVTDLKKTKTEEEVNDILKKAPFPYQWGVYTTAYARLQLQIAIDFAGDKIVYCDTDSIKTIGTVDIDKLNKEFKKKAIQQKAYAVDMKGKKHYIGLFEQDNYYEKFITQGAKRYAYIHNTCKYSKTCSNAELCGLGVTVAGVTKKINEDSGIPYAVEELQTLEKFEIGMTWYKAGGTTAVYNDKDDFDYTDSETGKQVRITKNVAIIPSTYEMSHERKFELLLDEIELYGDYKDSIRYTKKKKIKKG